MLRVASDCGLKQGSLKTQAQEAHNLILQVPPHTQQPSPGNITNVHS